MVPFEKAFGSSYRPSIVTFPLSGMDFRSVHASCCDIAFTRFRDIAAFVLQNAIFPDPTSSLPKIFPCSPGSRWIAFGCKERRCWANCACNFSSKISNLCDHKSPTSQTDRRTTCDRKTALCTKVHCAVKTVFFSASRTVVVTV